MRHILVYILSVLAVNIAHAGPASLSSTPRLRPVLSGTLALGGVSPDLGLDDDRAAFALEATARFANAAGRLSLNASVRHIADDSLYWRGKSKYTAGLDYPLSRNAVLFACYENKFRSPGNDDWSFAGVRFRFGGSR